MTTQYAIQNILFERDTEALTLKAKEENKRCKKGYKLHFYYRFRNLQLLELHQEKFLKQQEEQRKKAEQKQKTLAELKLSNPFQIGNIVYESWGYEQTNIDFYQIVEVKKCSVVIRKLKQETVETGFMCGHTVALKDEFSTEQTHFKVVKWSMWDKEPRPYLAGVFRTGLFLYTEGQKLACSWYA